MSRLPVAIKFMTEDQLRAYHREKQSGYREKARREKRWTGPTRAEAAAARKIKTRAAPKVCIWCQRALPRTAEYFYISSKDQCSSHCRECTQLRKRNIPYKQSHDLFKGGCAICGETDRATLVLDHCHTKNQFRDVLCGKCNSMLGFADDAPWILEQGAAYLRKHGIE